MKNYIVLDGKKIKLSKETVDNIKKQLDVNPYATFVDDVTEGFDTYLNVNGEVDNYIQIGKGIVDKEMIGRCLVLGNSFDWEILDNNNPYFNKILVAKYKSK